jgi:hypothetical protein
MQQNQKTATPDYRNAFLGLGFINLLWGFALIWNLYGMCATLVLAATLNHLITRLHLTLARRRYFGPERPDINAPR